jgi:hypothetical protein
MHLRDPCEDQKSLQRGSADLVKIVVNANLRKVETFLPNLYERALYRV